MGRHLEVDGKGSAGDGEGRWFQVPVVEGCDAVRRLGAGVSGTVWLVQPRDGSAPLAAKCFAPDPARQAAGEAGEILRHNESEITQEWRILAQNDHEHLLRAHRVVPLGGSWAGGSALLMDYAAGGSVRDIVAARGPLSVGECVTVLTPLGQVLSFLHGAGIRHGDVSPGNVLLTAQGKPVLADLGLGRLVGQGHGSGGGTPGFFCPQDPGVSAGSDVYSMAAVGWFALTGQAPPATRDRMPLAMYARDVPPELAAALEAGLSENVAQRPTAAAFAQAVFRSARAEPVALAHAVHPSDLPELLTRRAARQPRGPAFLRLRRGSPRERRGTGRWPRFEARFGFGLVAGSGHPFGRMPLRRLARVRGLGWRLLAAWVAGAVAAACLAAWLVLPGAGPRAGSGFPLAAPITVPGGT
ncbi:MAG: protein kinase, partial [Specibacter sp.]